VRACDRSRARALSLVTEGNGSSFGGTGDKPEFVLETLEINAKFDDLTKKLTNCEIWRKVLQRIHVFIAAFAQKRVSFCGENAENAKSFDEMNERFIQKLEKTLIS
jgi:hypothetical protein